MPRSRLSDRDQFHDLAPALRVEVAGGLVGQEHQRLRDKRARHRHSLLLSAGKFSGCVHFPAGQPHRSEGLPCGFPPLRSGLTPVKQREFDVFERRRARQQIETLKDKAKKCLRNKARWSRDNFSTCTP